MGEMTTRRIKRDARWEDLLAVPEHLVAEIVNGDLVTSPRPAPRHARTSSGLGVDLGSAFDRGRNGPGGWWILDEPELHLGKDVLVPDVAGWRRKRMPRLPEETFFSLSPDWVCEVLSASTMVHDRVTKVPLYARHGIAHLWLLDPVARTLEVLELDSDRWVLLASHANDEFVRAVPFQAIELSLAPLWDDGWPRPVGEEGPPPAGRDPGS